jgi:hypothetical protein
MFFVAKLTQPLKFRLGEHGGRCEPAEDGATKEHGSARPL